MTDTNTRIRDALTRIRDDATAMLALLPPPSTIVPAGGDLQAALDQGGVIELEAGATYPGSFVLRSNTTLLGKGATVQGAVGAPALSVPVGATDISVSYLTVTGAYGQLIRVGRNDSTQTTLDQVPQRITFTRVNVPSHRGTRAFEINGADVSLIDCEVAETWSPALQDSQAVCVLNSPGPVLIQGGQYSAGSEIVMVGGDVMKIPGAHPTGITITHTHLIRPESWRTDGISRAVKNLIELKDGQDVLIADNDLEGCWVNAQDGPAIVLTSKAGGNVQRVTIERNRITRAGYGFQMLAADYHVDALPTPALMGGIVIRQNVVSVSKTMGWTGADGVFHGSRGLLALILGGVRDVTFDGNTAITDGAVFVEADSRGNYLSLDRVLVPNPPIGRLTITNNRLISGLYGLRINGYQGGTQPTPPGVEVLEFTGNTVADATATLKKTFPAPSNTYVTRAEWDALVGAL